MNDNIYRQQSDAVPVKTDRVYDSCSDKDCFSDLLVTLDEGTLPDNINIVRSRAATVENVCVNVEPIPFNRGFYSIDITFTFTLEILGYETSRCTPTVFSGKAYASKNCILYGSESSVRTFRSTDDPDVTVEDTDNNLPTAIVSVLEPIALNARIGCSQDCGDQEQSERSVFVTLGLFSVVELTRPVTVLVPTLDYTIPRKECNIDSDSPCEVFEKLKFPEDEFSPTALTDSSDSCCCNNDSLS